MHSGRTDDLRATAAGLARWYDEEMDPDTQAAFRACDLGADLRRLGFALDAPGEVDEAARERAAKNCVIA